MCWPDKVQKELTVNQAETAVNTKNWGLAIDGQTVSTYIAKADLLKAMNADKTKSLLGTRSERSHNRQYDNRDGQEQFHHQNQWCNDRFKHNG